MSAHGTFGSVVAVLAAAVMLFSACGKKSNAADRGGGSAALLGSRTAGSVGTVLTDSSGRTLYHLTTEQGGHIMCTGGCATVWPPVLASGSVPSSVAGLPGRVGTIARPDGSTQVTYAGLPLYRYSGDTAPGQANGQGIQGVWFAVTPSGTASGTSPSPTSSARGYGY